MAAKKKKQVTLHVPSAPFRPGDKASFAPFENEPGTSLGQIQSNVLHLKPQTMPTGL